MKVGILIPALGLLLALSSSFASAQLCYDPDTKSHRSGLPGEPEVYDKNFRHTLALSAARLVYKMADLTTSKSAVEILQKHAEFNALIPPHYQVTYKTADRTSGIKYAILEPTQRGLPYILAITGTESTIDWFIDLNLGRSQLAQLKGMQYLLGYCNYQAQDGQAYSAKNWIITGHSLGGGLAQAFAYEVQKMRLRAHLAPAKIDLITFNAFGASELVEKTPAETAGVAKTMSIANYFLTDDLVSRIGVHIGPTFEIDARALPEGVGSRHALYSFWRALGEDNGFSRAQLKKPTAAKALNFLKGVAPYLEFIHEPFTDTLNVRLGQVRVLEEATNILIKRQFSEAFDKEAARFLSGMAFQFQIKIEKEPQDDLRRDMIARLYKIQQRLR